MGAMGALDWPDPGPGLVAPSDPDVELRPVKASDADFLLLVYSAARAPELAQIAHWTDEQKHAFLQQQFYAQHVHYFTHYEAATYEIILHQGKPAGRLYLHMTDADLRIMDIALAPQFYNQGIGGGLLRDLQTFAANKSMSVSIHVERYNPALRLYKRLGFRVAGENGVYYLLEWRPSQLERAGAVGAIPEGEILELS